MSILPKSTQLRFNPTVLTLDLPFPSTPVSLLSDIGTETQSGIDTQHILTENLYCAQVHFPSTFPLTRYWCHMQQTYMFTVGRKGYSHFKKIILSRWPMIPTLLYSSVLQVNYLVTCIFKFLKTYSLTHKLLKILCFISKYVVIFWSVVGFWLDSFMIREHTIYFFNCQVILWSKMLSICSMRAWKIHAVCCGWGECSVYVDWILLIDCIMHIFYMFSDFMSGNSVSCLVVGSPQLYNCEVVDFFFQFCQCLFYVSLDSYCSVHAHKIMPSW